MDGRELRYGEIKETEIFAEGERQRESNWIRGPEKEIRLGREWERQRKKDSKRETENEVDLAEEKRK